MVAFWDARDELMEVDEEMEVRFFLQNIRWYSFFIHTKVDLQKASVIIAHTLVTREDMNFELAV